MVSSAFDSRGDAHGANSGKYERGRLRRATGETTIAVEIGKLVCCRRNSAAATTNLEIGNALGLSEFKGTSDLDEVLREIIGYSALDSNAPFGTMAIRSLFADANKLGALVANNALPAFLNTDAAKNALAEILVQYAGVQAAYAGTNGGRDLTANGTAADANGAFARSDSAVFNDNFPMPNRSAA